MKQLSTGEEYQEINRRLSKLETHVINLIHPIQSLNKCLNTDSRVGELVALFNKPIEIDDRHLRRVLDEFWKALTEFKALDLVQAFAEIKYIGNRMNEVEKLLREMHEKGIRKNVHLDVTVDGFKMMAKSMEVDETHENPLKELLSKLTSLERDVFVHKLGLLGEKVKTYTKIAEIVGFKAEKVSSIFKNTCRKIRSKDYKNITDKIIEPDIREILGRTIDWV